ncbi:MAG: nucleotide sugar dehydrogenase [Deltaproteobacteria bacterium]|nr:nucleotide sugar dehydrogenase [Deltaproteobacteria bacterium]
MTDWRWTVCVVGTGRVGLPLALSFLEAGVSVVGVDRDARLRDQINAGEMPFGEPGYDELIATRRLRVVEDPAVVAQCRFVVVTVGTPLRANIEADMRQVDGALRDLTPQLRAGQLVALRSTLAPRTTELVARRIERATGLRVGVDLGVACCPERLAEGHAKVELGVLPQVVGADDELSARLGHELFAPIAPDVLATSTINAEFLKLFTNVERYVHFAVANQFAMVADVHGANIHEIRRMANDRYPRNHIASPGFSAGACLRKDFGMLAEWSPYVGIPTAAWRIHESMPTFLVQHMERRMPLLDKRIAVLGYSFKSGSDDMRDSLTPKLMRYIQRSCPLELRVNDPHLPDPIDDPVHGSIPNHPIERCLDGVDGVFIATNHPQYHAALRRLAETRPDAWVADLWNVGENDQLFYRAGESAGTS